MKIKLLFLTTVMAGVSACNKVTVDDYYGQYDMTDDCRNAYTITIREASTDNHVMIDNFMNRLDYSEASVDGKTISFTDEEVWSIDVGTGTQVRYTVTANGTFKIGEIEWSYHYELDDNSLSENCTATAEKR